FFSKLRDASRLKLVQDQLLPVGRGNDVDIVYCPVPTTLAGPNRVRELAQEHEAAHRAARLEGICARAGTEVELHCAVTLVPGGSPHPVGEAPREGVWIPLDEGSRGLEGQGLRRRDGHELRARRAPAARRRISEHGGPDPEHVLDERELDLS